MAMRVWPRASLASRRTGRCASCLLYVAVALVLWIGCALLALVPSKRRVAWRTALSMAASFPGVFTAQALAAPLVGTWLVLLSFETHLIDAGPMLHSLAAIWLSIAAVLVAGIGVLATSLYGFRLGWDVAWRISGGATWKAALRAHWPFDLILRAIG
jgi:hypothetical protein